MRHIIICIKGHILLHKMPLVFDSLKMKKRVTWSPKRNIKNIPKIRKRHHSQVFYNKEDYGRFQLDAIQHEESKSSSSTEEESDSMDELSLFVISRWMGPESSSHRETTESSNDTPALPIRRLSNSHEIVNEYSTERPSIESKEKKSLKESLMHQLSQSDENHLFVSWKNVF